jgi:hypothetical protein
MLSIVELMVIPYVFWTLLILSGSLLILSLELENIFGSWLLIAFLSVLLYWNFEEVGIFFRWGYDHPLHVFLWVFVYFIIGTAWSLFKWYIYVKSCAKRMSEKPVLFSHRRRIMSTITLWPPSMIWYFIHEPITIISTWVYDNTTKAYQAITDSVYKVDK